MGNVHIGHNNKVDAGTLSGGAYVPTLPLVNLQDQKLGRVARTTNAQLASTIVKYDAGKNVTMRLLSIVNHNFSISAKFRVRVSVNADLSDPLYDSGWLDAWPTVYAPENLEWEDDNWWDGKYLAEEIEGFTNTLIHLMPELYLARYLQVEFDDLGGNPDGYLQYGRLFIGDIWTPRINMSFGSQISLETNTRVDQTLSGSESFDPKKPYRVARFSTDWLSDNEAFGGAFEIERKQGIHGEVIYIHDTADTLHANRRWFYGRLRNLNPIENVAYDLRKKGWEVKERI